MRDVAFLAICSAIVLTIVVGARIAVAEPDYIESGILSQEGENPPEIADSGLAGASDETGQEAMAEPEPEPEIESEPEPAQQGGVITREGGVNWHDGRKECWYSSNVLYHYRTAEWWLDEEGFYRTDDGYYVVAASDLEFGTVFEGSKGTCIVLDSGCEDGTTDYYVGW